VESEACISLLGMSPPDDTTPPGNPGGEALARDLIDFFRRWPEFRHIAMLLTERSDLSLVEQETVHWLILLVDRISEYDLRLDRP
jgi:hypothetical protein